MAEIAAAAGEITGNCLEEICEGLEEYFGSSTGALDAVQTDAVKIRRDDDDDIYVTITAPGKG